MQIGSLSLPSRGAWIEIEAAAGRPADSAGRSPHGERGLKFHLLPADGAEGGSLPSRGAWIEMAAPQPPAPQWPPSLPSRGAWIEIPVSQDTGDTARSLPSRGAWIEMTR